MPIAIVSSKGQLVIPKDIRDTLGIKAKQKVLLKLVRDHAVIEPLPEDPVEHFCGIFKEGTSLTRALLTERKEEKSVYNEVVIKDMDEAGSEDTETFVRDVKSKGGYDVYPAAYECNIGQ